LVVAAVLVVLVQIVFWVLLLLLVADEVETQISVGTMVVVVVRAAVAEHMRVADLGVEVQEQQGRDTMVVSHLVLRHTN
jgi:hypothetical protein